MTDKAKILITGASGFIGHHLSKYLISKGFYVIGTYNKRKPHIIHNSFLPLYIRDAHSKNSWVSIVSSVDYVIHLIGKAHVFDKKNKGLLKEFREVNVEITRALATSCFEAKKLKKIIYVSSVSAVASSSTLPLKDDSVWRPDTEYGLTKHEAEKTLEEVLGDSKAWCILRPPSIYGPGDPGNLSRLINLIKKSVPLPFRNVENKRSFLFIGNFNATVYRLILRDDIRFKKYLIADNEIISTPGLLKLIAKILNKRVFLFYFPKELILRLGDICDYLKVLTRMDIGFNSYAVERLLGSLFIDNSRIKKELSFDLPFSLREGLKETLKG